MTCHICGCGIDDFYVECGCGSLATHWSWRVALAAVLWAVAWAVAVLMTTLAVAAWEEEGEQ